MTPASLIKLIHSLSGPEKRHFKLQSKIQGNNKEYLILFELISQYKNPDIQKLKEEFTKKSPNGSWDNTCIYLGKMVVNALVKVKKEKDIFFELLQRIQEIKILKERSLEEEALKLIKKVKQKAARYQLHWIEYYCQRYELNHYSENNFPEVGEDRLIKLQMKGKEILKSFNHIHDHYSLYELLKYRLIYAGKVVSEEDKKKLNDLMLSEIALVAGRSKSFTSQKLHLLFQSFFFTDIGDYRSALKSFYQLNELLEKNEAYLDNPPIDYLSALTGIMDSLRMLQNTTELDYYLAKLKKLDRVVYPEYFRYVVRKTIAIEQIIALLQAGELKEAIQFLNVLPADVYDNYTMADEEKQCELYFYTGLVHFMHNDLRKAHFLIREIMSQLRLPEQLIISRAIRLLNIIIYFQKGEILHLEYEIRSYKRYFMQSRLLKIEKILFKIMGAASFNKRLQFMRSEQKKLSDDLENVATDRYEQQLMKYFDFANWAQSLLEK